MRLDYEEAKHNNHDGSNARIIMKYESLWKEVSKQKLTASSPIHGLNHWRCVFRNGSTIAKETGANIDLVELFALFHDSCRKNDGKDSKHGRRAADWVASMRADFPDLSEDLFQFLLEALRDHTHVKNTDNIHIAACWDADRLDLDRVYISPEEEYMNTETGRLLAKRKHNIDKQWYL